MDFENSVIILKEELNSKYSNEQIVETSSRKDDGRRLQLIRKIQTIMEKIMKSIASNRFPVLKTISHTNWENCTFDDRIKLGEIRKKNKNISFRKANGRCNFAAVIFLLSKIHKLLIMQQKCTRREIYYENLEIFKSQAQVDNGMRDICYLLNAPTWELGVLATSKGLVSGPLVLTLPDGEIIDCSVKGGVAIPPNVFELEKMSSCANWVLIVEKDASFQRLVINNASERLGPCILITGKGYPDMSTRMLVCKFWQVLRIPILALVDADPYGFEIMSVYRFGSVMMSSYSEHLACPAVRWLGVHPSDIRPLLLQSEVLSLRDIGRIRSLLEKQFVQENEHFKSQLRILLEENMKAEIEGVANISTNYLVDVYIKNKIHCKDYF